MRRVLKVKQQFWANAGTAPLGTLASGSVLWYTPTAGTAGAVTNAQLASQWLKIPLGGDVDKVFVVYRSKITAIGGLVNVTGANVVGVACGQFKSMDDPDLDVPAATLFAPAFVGANAGGSRQGGDLLACVFWEGGTVQPSAAVADQAGYNGGGIFGEASPNALNDPFGYTFEITPRQSLTTSGLVGASDRSLAGLEDLYLAIGTFQTMTGTLATTQLKGKIMVYGYQELAR